MSRVTVDHALRSLQEDRDRISAALLDLEGHSGYQLLKGARLAGETRRRWDRAEARLTLIWRLFDAYQRVLDSAAALRDRHAKPGDAVLRQLTDLLAGESVELPLDEVPLEKRTLLQPTSERLTLDDAVERMTAAYSDAIELIASVDAAWEALLGPLDEAEEGWREASRLVRTLGAGRNPEVDRIGRELAAVGQLIRTDPLALGGNPNSEPGEPGKPGKLDTARLDAVRADLAEVRRALAEAVRVRDGYEQRVAELAAALDRLAGELDAAGAAFETVQVKILDPGVGRPAGQLPVLRERLDALAEPRAAGHWQELARKVADLEAAVAAAHRQAEHDHRLITGLLDRRNELRGRLDAYRAKAARLGFAEHDQIAELYGRARELLWTAPCDLRGSTVVLAEFQRVLRSLETGTD